MSYADLPVELWETILSVAPLPATAQFLATNRGVRADYLPMHLERLAQAKEAQRIEDLRAGAQQWLVDRALERVAQLGPRKLQKGGFRAPLLVAPGLAELLGANFPRVFHKGQTYVVANAVTLLTWLHIYVKLNHLEVKPMSFRVDATLAALSGFPEGSVQPNSQLPLIYTRQRIVDPSLVVTPEQWKQLLFVESYLQLIQMILYERVFADDDTALRLKEVDPTLEGFRALRALSPPPLRR